MEAISLRGIVLVQREQEILASTTIEKSPVYLIEGSALELPGFAHHLPREWIPNG